MYGTSDVSGVGKCKTNNTDMSLTSLKRKKKNIRTNMYVDRYINTVRKIKITHISDSIYWHIK